MIKSIAMSVLVLLFSSSVAVAQIKPHVPPRQPVSPTLQPGQPAGAVTLKLSGTVKLRPQNTDKALSASERTILLDDESLVTTTNVAFAAVAEKNSFATDFPTLVLQRRDSASGPWIDHYTRQTVPKSITVPGQRAPAPTPQPTAPPRPELPQLGSGVTPRPDIPQEPGQGPRPKTGPPFDSPKTTVPGLSFSSSSLTLPAGTTAIRASARRADGTSLDSPPLQLEVRKAPAILTLLAQGGACGDADGNLDSSGTVTRNKDKCAAKQLNGVFLGDLTSKASINCNDFCNTGCMNFFEHLATEIMDLNGLADQVDSINNPGTALCQHRTNPAGIRNRIVIGKWRNTEEETALRNPEQGTALLCQTPRTFNKMIDDFQNQGGKSLILIGQSLGGAKLTKMVRDNWRWGNALTLELFVLWDATSLGEDGMTFNGHFQPDLTKPKFNPVGIPSFGVRKVGTRPKKVLTFFQYSNLFAFQNGAPLDLIAEPHPDAEQHDYDGCLSHNGIARSQFVHHRTTEVVKVAIQAARDRARK